MFSIWTKVLLQLYSNYYWILQNLPVRQITKFVGLPMSMTLRQSFMILLSKAAQNRWVKSSFSRKHDCKLIFCYVNTLLNSLSKQLSKWGKSDGLKNMVESWNWFPIFNVVFYVNLRIWTSYIRRFFSFFARNRWKSSFRVSHFHRFIWQTFWNTHIWNGFSDVFCPEIWSPNLKGSLLTWNIRDAYNIFRVLIIQCWNSKVCSHSFTVQITFFVKYFRENNCLTEEIT